MLDIDELYRRMTDRGIRMIDEIQGPPLWEGPDVLLRQTSFRALAEPRTFRTPSGEIVQDSLRVRFGEVEARGIALTRAGRELYDAAIVRGATPEVWRETFPATEAGLVEADLGYFTYDVSDDGTLTREPVVYEDFLPRSAAGIFQSNLTDEGSKDATQEGEERDADWMSGAIGRDLHDPFELYARQVAASLETAAARLGVAPETLTARPTATTPATTPATTQGASR